MSREIIRIECLGKRYGEVEIFKNISTTVYQGDVISIIGSSGTGKSTFIRCLNFLERPTSGKIFIDGEELTAPDADIVRIRKKMGMVFQSFNLFPHLSVVENIMMAPIDQLGMPKQEAYDLAMELLDTVGMMDKAYASPDALSGGQKQRVAIARSLAMKPEILLLDEPTSALDPERVEEVQAVIYQLAKKGMTMLIVTHEMRFARNASNRIFYMDEGGIYEEGTPDEIFDHPKREKTRRFIHQEQHCSFAIQSVHFDYYDVLGLLERFCRDNRISVRLQNRLSVVLEEIILNMIMPVVVEDKSLVPDVQFEMEARDQRHIVLSLTFPENYVAVIQTKDSLSSKLVKGMSQETHDSSENGVHQVIMKFGE